MAANKKVVSTDDINRLCQIVDEFLPPHHGFIIFAFPTAKSQQSDDSDEHLRYASNCNRKDAVNALKSWMIQRGYDENWMRHDDDEK